MACHWLYDLHPPVACSLASIATTFPFIQDVEACAMCLILATGPNQQVRRPPVCTCTGVM